MSKFLAIPLLLLGMGLMPMAAYSGMGKRIQEAENAFPQEPHFLTSVVENLLAKNPGIQVVMNSNYSILYKQES